MSEYKHWMSEGIHNVTTGDNELRTGELFKIIEELEKLADARARLAEADAIMRDLWTAWSNAGQGGQTFDMDRVGNWLVRGAVNGTAPQGDGNG